MNKFVLFVFLLLTCYTVKGKVFTRCDLARELIRQGFPMKDLQKWICLIEAESDRNTKKKGGPNRNTSYDLGLFQLNGFYFCKENIPGGKCKMYCSDFLSDDITNASLCAFSIFQQFGFSIWPKWNDNCVYTLPSIDRCGLKHVKPLVKPKIPLDRPRPARDYRYYF